MIKSNEYNILKEQENEVEKLHLQLGDNEFDKIGDSCSSDNECGSNNLICDEYNQCNIKYNKKLIGEKCIQENDCYSGFCNINKMCRKQIHYCQ
jgi:hypothetical protein